MKDNFGREINYLRVSVTQRCNLNCLYCGSEKPDTDEMTADEIYSWAKREKKAGEVIEDLLVIQSADIAKYAADKSLADLTKVKNYSADHAFIDADDFALKFFAV